MAIDLSELVSEILLQSGSIAAVASAVLGVLLWIAVYRWINRVIDGGGYSMGDSAPGATPWQQRDQRDGESYQEWATRHKVT